MVSKTFCTTKTAQSIVSLIVILTASKSFGDSKVQTLIDVLPSISNRNTIPNYSSSTNDTPRLFISSEKSAPIEFISANRIADSHTIKTGPSSTYTRGGLTTSKLFAKVVNVASHSCFDQSTTSIPRPSTSTTTRHFTFSLFSKLKGCTSTALIQESTKPKIDSSSEHLPIRFTSPKPFSDNTVEAVVTDSPSNIDQSLTSTSDSPTHTPPTLLNSSFNSNRKISVGTSINNIKYSSMSLKSYNDSKTTNFIFMPYLTRISSTANSTKNYSNHLILSIYSHSTLHTQQFFV